VTGAEQLNDSMTADVAGTTRYQDRHVFLLPVLIAA
jgi:hypothetical protein